MEHADEWIEESTIKHSYQEPCKTNVTSIDREREAGEKKIGIEILRIKKQEKLLKLVGKKVE